MRCGGCSLTFLGSHGGELQEQQSLNASATLLSS